MEFALLEDDEGDFNIEPSGASDRGRRSRGRKSLKRVRNVATDVRNGHCVPPEEAFFMCKSRCCTRVCEQSACCRSWGSVGVSEGRGSCGKRGKTLRHVIFRLTTTLSILATLLQIIVCMGVTDNDQLLMGVAWSRGTFIHPESSEVYKIWIGCEHYVVETPTGAIVGIDWEDKYACMFRNTSNISYEMKHSAQEACENCRDQSGPNIVSAVLAVIFAFQGVRFNFVRGGDASTDLNSYKGLGAFHCMSVILFNVAVISSFWDSCVVHLSDNAPDNSFMPGVGLVFLLTIVSIKFVNLLVHVCIKTPIERRRIASDDDDIQGGEP